MRIWRVVGVALLLAWPGFAQGPTQAPTGVWIDARQYDLFHVVIPEDASAELRYAAEMFVKYWKLSTGHEIKIGHRNDGYINVWLGPEVVTRDLLRPEELEGLGKDGFVIRTYSPTARFRNQGAREQLVISGATHMGTIHGVFEFFRRAVGAQWFAPGVVHVPRAGYTMGTVSVRWTAPIERRDIGVLRMLEAGGECSREALVEFRRAHFLRPDFVDRSVARVTPWDLLPVAEGETPPPYFKPVAAAAAGSRNARLPAYFKPFVESRAAAPCMLEAGTAEAVTAELRRLLSTADGALGAEASRRKKDVIRCFNRQDGVTLLSAALHDAPYCDACRAFAEAEGTPVAPVLLLANRVAEALEASPAEGRRLVHVLLFGDWCAPPKHLRPHKNVIIELSTLGTNASVPLAEGEGNNRAFASNLREWSRLTDRLAVLDYAGNAINRQSPVPDWTAYQENLHFYVQHGVNALFYYAPRFWAGGFAELDAFRAYLLAQLLVDADQRVGVLQEEFVGHYYGPAAGAVGAYLAAMAGAAKGAVCAPGAYEAPLFLNAAALQGATEAFDRLEIGGLEEPYRLRAARAQVPLDFVRLFSGAGADGQLRFTCTPEAAGVEAYVERLKALGESAPAETSLAPLSMTGQVSLCKRMLGVCGGGDAGQP